MKFTIFTLLAASVSGVVVEYDTSYDEKKIDAFNRWINSEANTITDST